MSFDYFEFVEAYRVGDSIAIGYGYQKHSDVWMAIAQYKYVDIFYTQRDVLYRDNPFSVLQELHTNIVVRQYHSDTGKRCVPQDEFSVNGNHFFSECPMPKTITSFAFQS